MSLKHTREMEPTGPNKRAEESDQEVGYQQGGGREFQPYDDAGPRVK